MDSGKRGVRLFPDGASEAKEAEGVQNMTTFETYLKRKMRDPRFKAEYERLKRSPQTSKEIIEEAERYSLALPFLTEIRNKWLKGQITPKDYKRLREQAISGDKKGAMQELGKILEGKYNEQV